MRRSYKAESAALEKNLNLCQHSCRAYIETMRDGALGKLRFMGVAIRGSDNSRTSFHLTSAGRVLVVYSDGITHLFSSVQDAIPHYDSLMNTDFRENALRILRTYEVGAHLNV